MSDLIDRQAVLDCFHSWVDKRGDMHTPDEMPEYEAIEDLPTIELEKYKPNEEYNNMIRELLQIEEKLDHFNLTTHERRQFQNYVEDRIGEVWIDA